MSVVQSRRPGLAALLFALAVLYVAWFWNDKHFVATLLVFALPPLLLAIGAAFGRARAAFWAGVFGLFWFSHGVMTAYSHADRAAWAWGEIVLSVWIVLASSWPGLRARFGRTR